MGVGVGAAVQGFDERPVGEVARGFCELVPNRPVHSRGVWAVAAQPGAAEQASLLGPVEEEEA